MTTKFHRHRLFTRPNNPYVEPQRLACWRVASQRYKNNLQNWQVPLETGQTSGAGGIYLTTKHLEQRKRPDARRPASCGHCLFGLACLLMYEVPLMQGIATLHTPRNLRYDATRIATTARMYTSGHQPAVQKPCAAVQVRAEIHSRDVRKKRSSHHLQLLVLAKATGIRRGGLPLTSS